MRLIPAMDLRHGQCVYTEWDKNRFEHARYTDPLAIAAQWVDAGYDHIHLIDLDGYQKKEPVNVPVVRQLVKTFPDCEFEICGGITNEEHVLIWLDSGVQKVVLTKSALSDADTLAAWCLDFPRQLVMLVELKNHHVFGNLSRFYGNTLDELLSALAETGIQRVILTELEISESPPTLAKSPDAIEIWLYLGRKLNSGTVSLAPFIDCGAEAVVIGRAVHDGMPQLPRCTANKS